MQFWSDLDAQNRALNDIDDYFFDKIRDGCGAKLTSKDIDDVIERVMRVARNRAGK